MWDVKVGTLLCGVFVVHHTFVCQEHVCTCGLPPEMPLWANTLRVQNEFHVYMYMYIHVCTCTCTCTYEYLRLLLCEASFPG